MGNSIERVFIKDLGDTIYYKQIKEYTDEAFESKYLQKEIRKGRITVLEKYDSVKAVFQSQQNSENVLVKESSPGISVDDIKKAIKEVIPEISNNSGNGNSVNDVVKEAIPLILNTVRQEMSSLINQGSGYHRTPIDSEYIPEITTSNMISNIKAEEREVSGDTVSDNLAALRKLKGLKNKT